MIRIGDPLEIRLMALVAIRVVQLIVPVHVTRLARCRCVSTSQREERCAMIERRWTPRRC